MGGSSEVAFVPVINGWVVRADELWDVASGRWAQKSQCGGPLRRAAPSFSGKLMGGKGIMMMVLRFHDECA